jgi:hypothetical protein
MNRIAARFLALTLAVGLPAAAAAHHGWAWTEDKETRLSGTIESISFGNPHMHLQVRASKGVWEVDLSPPIVAQRSGFGRGAAEAGDTVILTGHRARDHSVLAFKAETVTVNGKTYDVYPQRDKSLKPEA